MKLTELERMVLQRVADGEDPRGPLTGTASSRVHSQALQRLHRKGALVYLQKHSPSRRLTEAGRAALSPPRAPGDGYCECGKRLDEPNHEH